MDRSMNGPKPYREGDQPELDKQKVSEDNGTKKEVKPITAVVLVLTDEGVDLIGDIQGIDVQRKATFHDIVMMASAVHAEATAKISSHYTAEAMMKSMAMAQRAMATAPSSNGPMAGPGGIPIIGRGGRKRGN